MAREGSASVACGVSSWEGNEVSLHLYRKHGFTVQGRDENESGRIHVGEDL